MTWRGGLFNILFSHNSGSLFLRKQHSASGNASLSLKNKNMLGSIQVLFCLLVCFRAISSSFFLFSALHWAKIRETWGKIEEWNVTPHIFEGGWSYFFAAYFFDDDDEIFIKLKLPNAYVFINNVVSIDCLYMIAH